jgi:NH3-dependent NAD+ synthetase
MFNYKNRSMSNLTTQELRSACKKVGNVIGLSDGRADVATVLRICQETQPALIRTSPCFDII